MPAQQFTIGIDVGGTNMRAARISPDGALLQKVSVAGSRDPATAVGIIKNLIADMNGGQAGAIGIGIPGRVDGWTAEIISGGYLNLAGVDLKSEIQRAFGVSVTIANDGSMALIGEARVGAARGLRSVAMLTIGTGIGGALMENGRIVNGRRCAGQLGHLIVKHGGQPCACGQRGCVESESSGTALRRHLNEAGFGPETGIEQVLQLAQASTGTALGVLRAWAGPLRAAIQSLAAAVDPEVVLLGGGLGQAACEALQFVSPVKNWFDVEVRPAQLGDDAGVIGSGLAAFDLLQVVPPASGKRLVMVNGVPASGKSALARDLAAKTGWPILSIDTIKDPHLELIENVDRDFNRVLGRASYKAMFSIIRDAAPGSTFIVDAWFGFQPIETLKQHIAMAGITEVAELWCHAPPAVIGERYRQRAGTRPPGHPGLSYVPELIALAGRAQPARLGPVLDIETTQAWDIDAITRWANSALHH